MDVKQAQLMQQINYCGAVMYDLADSLAYFSGFDKTMLSKAGEMRGAADLLVDDWGQNIKKVFQNECEK